MFCSNCGKEFESNYCPNCGTIASKPDIDATEQQQPLTPMQTQEDYKKQEPADSSAKEAIEAKNGFSRFFQSKRNIIIAVSIAVILVVAIIIAVVLQPSSNLTIEDFNFYSNGVAVKTIGESQYASSLKKTEETKRGIKLGDTFSTFVDAYAGINVEDYTYFIGNTSYRASDKEDHEPTPITDLQSNRDEYIPDTSKYILYITLYTVNGQSVDSTSYEEYIESNFKSEYDNYKYWNTYYVDTADWENWGTNVNNWRYFLKDNNVMCLSMSATFKGEILTSLETTWS